MIDNILRLVSSKKEIILYGLLGILISFATYLFFFDDNPIVAVLLLGGLVLSLLIQDYRIIYFIFFLSIPYSIEVQFSSTLGTDLPTEPQMWLLFLVGIVLFITKGKNVNMTFAMHPISLLLILHIFSIFVTAWFSTNSVISYKFFLAKLWYVIPFFFIPFHFIRDIDMFKKLLKFCIWSLALGITIVIIRHGLKGFTFDTINSVMYPFFRNHVTYASIAVLVLPFVWAFYKTTEKKSLKKAYAFLIVLYIIGINLSFTRAAMGSIFLGIVAYFLIEYKLIKYVIGVAGVLLIMGISFISQGNKWLDYAPNYQRTIAHHNFDNLMEATYKLEDISSMERVHRWVAGVQMIKEKPVLGFGPGCFYSSYKPYTVNSFETYVSDNPEKSGIHCYYLMTFVEQGFFGFIIFALLIIALLIYGEKVYHNARNHEEKYFLMAANICIIIILILNLINDMIEVDKVGTFFFLCASIFVIFDLKNRKSINPTTG